MSPFIVVPLVVSAAWATFVSILGALDENTSVPEQWRITFIQLTFVSIHSGATAAGLFLWQVFA